MGNSLNPNRGDALRQLFWVTNMTYDDKQRKEIAELLLKAYPLTSVCSQSLARDIALQLPRVINDFRYKPQWKLEDFHTKWGINLKSVKCTHAGTRQARDYKLSTEGYVRLGRHYTPGSQAPTIPLERPKEAWMMEYYAYQKEGRTYKREVTPDIEPLLKSCPEHIRYLGESCFYCAMRMEATA